MKTQSNRLTFSQQMVSLKRRTALVLPQKLRNFRSQSALTADQMM